MLTKLKDRLEDMMHTRLSWNRSRGKAAAARVEDRIEHAVEQLVVRRYGALGAAAVQDLQGRASGDARRRVDDRRRRQRGVAATRSIADLDRTSISDRSPIGGRGGGSLPACPIGSRARLPSILRICNRFARVLGGMCSG